MNSKIRFSYVVGIALFFVSCGTGPKKESSSSPEKSATLETIAILGTNDIHGGIVPADLQTREVGNSTPVHYTSGGAAVLATYIQTLRSEFGDHMLWFDAGDQFQGSIESNSEKGAPMVQFFNLLGLSGAAIGNHEFDFGLDTLKTRMREAKYPYLAANILEKKTGKLADFPNTVPHLMVKAGNLKVGVIGLSTLLTPTTTRAVNVQTLTFDDLKTSTLREAQYLRKRGAQVILLVGHVGLKCDTPHSLSGRMMRKFSEPQGECGSRDEMVELLRSLPTGTVDAVISGHTHQIVHHWVADVPVIQGGLFGRYFNVIYLTYDWSQKKLLPDQTRIEGPVPVCMEVFQNQNDCNGDRPAPKNGRGPLVPAKFHGKEIQPDSRVSALLEEVIQKSDQKKKRKLGVAEHPIEHIRMAESPLGNLVADALKKAAGTDFAYVNSGGIRAPIEAGDITYGDVFRSIPFDNNVAVIHVTPAELKLFLQVAESGARGFGSISGLKLRLIDPDQDAPYEDLIGDGKYEPWKFNRLLSMTHSDGSPLENGRLYTLATLDFIVTGGDDLKWPMSKIPAERIQLLPDKVVREVVVHSIEQLKKVNTSEHPLVDKEHPRLKFEKVKVKHHSSKRRHRQRKKKK